MAGAPAEPGEECMRLVMEGWAVVEEDLEGIGAKFFVHLFDKHPDMLQLFRFRLARDLAGSPGLRFHGKVVLRTVGEAATGKKTWEEMVKYLKGVGVMHKPMGTQAHHFPLVREALLETLHEVLGDKWTDEVRERWHASFEAVQQQFVASLEQARADA